MYSFKMKKIEKTKRERLNMFKIKIEAVSESYLKKYYFQCVWIGFTFCSVKKIQSLTF